MSKKQRIQRKAKYLNRYAQSFCDKVRMDFSKYKLTKNNPHVICYKEKGISPDGIIIDGEYADGKIYIYDCFGQVPLELKRTIKHEALHFILNQSGLPDKDDDDIFLLFAIKYNARPYALFNIPELQKG